MTANVHIFPYSAAGCDFLEWLVAICFAHIIVGEPKIRTSIEDAHPSISSTTLLVHPDRTSMLFLNTHSREKVREYTKYYIKMLRENERPLMVSSLHTYCATHGYDTCPLKGIFRKVPVLPHQDLFASHSKKYAVSYRTYENSLYRYTFGRRYRHAKRLVDHSIKELRLSRLRPTCERLGMDYHSTKAAFSRTVHRFCTTPTSTIAGARKCNDVLLLFEDAFSHPNDIRHMVCMELVHGTTFCKHPGCYAIVHNALNMRFCRAHYRASGHVPIIQPPTFRVQPLRRGAPLCQNNKNKNKK